MNESGIETVRAVAALARLEVGEPELREFAAQFERILGQFQVLARLDVSGVEQSPAAHPPEELRRKDEPRPSLAAEELLARAPLRFEDFYRVPKTVGGDP